MRYGQRDHEHFKSWEEFCAGYEPSKHTRPMTEAQVERESLVLGHLLTASIERIDLNKQGAHNG